MGRPKQAVILYDSDCGFCRWSLARVLAWDRRGLLRPLPLDSDEARALTPGMSDERRAASWHLVEADGTVTSAGAALRPLGRLLPGGRLLLSLPATLAPGLAERAYSWVARHRSSLGKVLRG